jgi:hypothetical protein
MGPLDLDRIAGVSAARTARALLRCLATIVGVLVLATNAAAQSDAAAASERLIKAAYLARFIEYVDWPADSLPLLDTPYTIGVVGEPELVDALRGIIVNRRIDGRALRVRSVAAGETATDAHVLFVAASSESAFRAALPAPDGPVLVVAQFPGALNHGATLNFVVLDGHVRFEASIPAAQHRHLKLGAGLLSVAMNVRRGGT